MCGLCGMLQDDIQWSERSPVSGASGQLLSARERMERAALLNRIVRPFACTVSDWQASSYILRSFTGNTVIVGSLAELWSALEKLGGRAVDPLDAQVLSSIDDGSA